MREKLNKKAKASRCLLNNNSGLTLLELIIAIVILSIVILPLFHSFSSAAKTTARAKKLSEATDAAQNIQESINASTAKLFINGDDTVLKMLNFTGSDGAGNITSGKNADGEDVAYVKNLVSGDSVFDAVVTFGQGKKNEETGEADGFYQINDKAIVNFAQADVTFVQPCEDEALAGKEDPDKYADVEVRFEYPNANFDAAEEAGRLYKNRTITITAENSEFDKEGNPIAVTISCKYEYTYYIAAYSEGAVEHKAEEYRLSEPYELPAQTVPVNEEGTPITTRLIYYPNYSGISYFKDNNNHYFYGGSSLYRQCYGDNIEIYNLDNAALRFFISKQWPYDNEDPTSVGTIERNKYDVSIYTYYTDEAKLNADNESITGGSNNSIIYTNAGINLNDDMNGVHKIMYSPTLVKHNGDITIYQVRDRGETINGKLIDESKSTRIYDITIDVYESGSITEGTLKEDAKLVNSYEGSKLN